MSMSLPGAPLLKVLNLRAYLRARRGIVHAVDGVSFNLHAGKTLAIVGESGCGKSVLCRTIMGLLPENAHIGKDSIVQFNGKHLIGLKESRYRRLRATHMAMVFQDSLSSLHPVMTVGRQIGESLRYHLNMNRQQAHSRTVSLIGSVGLSDPERCAMLYPHQLSGGMRQRIAMAIALACDPQLLIADEPTTALDVTVQAGILSLINHLQSDRRMSLILVTHDLGVAATVADNIAVMYAGKIVEIAPASVLFKRPGHPYTRALIDAIAQINPVSHNPLVSIKGQPCDLVSPPDGCRFSPRCPQAKNRCRLQEPETRANPADDHVCACWYPREGSLS